MRFDNELKPPLEEALEHYGVMGMRWGVRRTAAQLNKARKVRDSDIVDARKKQPKLDAKVKRSKAKYKNVKKHTKRSDEGRKAAKAVLKKAKNESWENWKLSSQDTSDELGVRMAVDLGARITNKSDFQRMMAQEVAVARIRRDKEEA